MKGQPRVGSDISEGGESRGINRRTLALGAAWTAPLVVGCVAAAAYAASGPCVTGEAALSPSTMRISKLTFLPAQVTAYVDYMRVWSDGTPKLDIGETGLVRTTVYEPTWNYIKLHHPYRASHGDKITMKLTFSQEVTNLSLTITDIDRDVGEWIDAVTIDTTGYTVAARGANVVGTGTAASAFRANTDGGIDSALGDVKLTWAGPLSEVQLNYFAADWDNASPIGQHVGIGQIGFTC